MLTVEPKDHEPADGLVAAQEKFFWNCTLCSTTYNSARKLDLHNFTIHGELLKWCKRCGLGFQTDKELAAHWKKFKDQEQCVIPCWDANCQHDGFSWLPDLLQHVEDHHVNQQSEALEIVRYDM